MGVKLLDDAGRGCGGTNPGIELAEGCRGGAVS